MRHLISSRSSLFSLLPNHSSPCNSLCPEQQQVASSSHQAPTPTQEDHSASVLRALQGAVIPPRPLAPLHGTAGASSSAIARHPTANPRPPSPPAPGAAAAGAGVGVRAGGGFILRVLGRVFGLPWAIIRAGLGGLWVATSLGLAIVTFIGSRVIPGRVLRAARGQLAPL